MTLPLTDLKPRWISAAIAPLQAAELWKTKCLIGDGSALTDRHLWTSENLNYLDRFFAQNLDYGTGDFWTKLQSQLAPAPAAAKQLAAEMFWVMYLVVHNEAMKPETKRLQIGRVWAWSGEPLPDKQFELHDALEVGIARPGTNYNTNRWREFLFFLRIAQALKSLSERQRKELLDDPWAVGAWVDSIPDASHRQFRHIFLFLVWPTAYDPILTDKNKKEIIDAFRSESGESPPYTYADRVDIDKEIFRLRGQLSHKYDADILDFYAPPLRAVWRPDDSPQTESDTGARQEALETWYNATFGKDAKVWALSAGEGARAWRKFQNEKLIGIGWDQLGDLREYESRDEIHAELRMQGGEDSNPSNDSLACWQFANDMRVGDWVLIKRGRSVLLGWGRISSDYEFRDSRSEYKHVRNAQWNRTGSWRVDEDRRIAPKTLTDFSDNKAWLKYAWTLTKSSREVRDHGARSYAYGLDQAIVDVFMTRAEFQTILDVFGRRKNLILQGPPGVGKTFVADRIAYALIGGERPDQVRRIQFHQSYSYEDFVQGFRPKAEGGFSLHNGLFHQFCENAAADKTNTYVLIIDEINRGNLSKIFGEMLMLIEADKRGERFGIALTYDPMAKFSVPENLYILGLMNTADRSLAFVDYALRRRFGFVTLYPAFSTDEFSNHLSAAEVPETIIQRIVSKMTALNATIASDPNLGPQFCIGHSFFVPQENDEDASEEWFRQIISTEIQPLLEEYWSEDRSQAQRQTEELLR